MPPVRQPLPEVLNVHPEWWTDPLPPWLFVAELDKRVLVELAAVQLEVQAQMLEQRAGAARKALEIVQKAI